MLESVFDRETDTSRAGGIRGIGKKNKPQTYQIWTKQPFCDLLQISNLADWWQNCDISPQVKLIEVCPQKSNQDAAFLGAGAAGDGGDVGRCEGWVEAW